jgi:hypothetical protein
LVSGPLNAGTVEPISLDPTINAEYLYNETGFFNFGYYKIEPPADPIDDRAYHFIAEIHTADSLVRPLSRLEIIPEGD